MSDGRRMLLETLAGHLALLKESHPRKAATQTAKKIERAVVSCLREQHQRKRAA